MYNPLFRYILNNNFLATVLIIAGAFFLYEIRSILVVIFVSFIIMAALEPAIKGLMKRGVPKIISVVLIYFLVLSIIVLLIIPLIPFFISQIQTLFDNLPRYVKEATGAIGINISARQVNDVVKPSIAGYGSNLVSITGQIFSGVLLVITTFIISLYMLLYHDKLENFTRYFVPRKMEEQAIETEKLIKEKLGAWLRGQIFLSFSVGVLTYIVLKIIGIDFALPLALLAGLLEIIPTVGPIISAIPAVIVAFSISPIIALTTALAYWLIQTIEGHFLVPKIMQKAVGLNPVIVIIAILVGGELMGVIGALLAIPFLSILIIFYKQLRYLE